LQQEKIEGLVSDLKKQQTREKKQKSVVCGDGREEKDGSEELSPLSTSRRCRYLHPCSHELRNRVRHGDEGRRHAAGEGWVPASALSSMAMPCSRKFCGAEGAMADLITLPTEIKPLLGHW